jgi:hypothetical protein
MRIECKDGGYDGDMDKGRENKEKKQNFLNHIINIRQF